MCRCCSCPTVHVRSIHSLTHAQANNSLKHKSMQSKQIFSIFHPTPVMHSQKYPIRIVLRLSWRNEFFFYLLFVQVNFYLKSRIQCTNDNLVSSLQLPLNESRYLALWWILNTHYTQHPGWTKKKKQLSGKNSASDYTVWPLKTRRQTVTAAWWRPVPGLQYTQYELSISSQFWGKKKKSFLVEMAVNQFTHSPRKITGIVLPAIST